MKKTGEETREDSTGRGKYTTTSEADRDLILTVVESSGDTLVLNRSGEGARIELSIVGTLGKPGAQGTTYRVKIKAPGKPFEEYAMKVFKRKGKSLK